MLTVTRLDRLARSTRDLLNIWRRLPSKGQEPMRAIVNARFHANGECPILALWRHFGGLTEWPLSTDSVD